MEEQLCQQNNINKNQDSYQKILITEEQLFNNLNKNQDQSQQIQLSERNNTNQDQFQQIQVSEENNTDSKINFQINQQLEQDSFINHQIKNISNHKKKICNEDDFQEIDLLKIHDIITNNKLILQNDLMNWNNQLQKNKNFCTKYNLLNFKLADHLINDLSNGYFLQQEKGKICSFFKNLFFFIQKNQEKIIILPNSKFNILWYLFMVTLTIFIICVESLIVFFQIKEKDKFYSGFYMCSKLKIIIILVFFVDIIKNFFTSFYKKGKLVANHHQIFKNYMTGHFILDIISQFGLITIYLIYDHEEFTNCTRFLFFLKISSIRLYFLRLESAFVIKESFKYWIRLAKLLIMIIFTAHFCACLFFGIAKAEYYYLGIEDTWLNQNNNNLLESRLYVQYIYSFYWASGLLIQSINYNPKTHLETLLTTILVFITMILIACVINIVGKILSDMNKKNEKYLKELDIINRYMEKQQIDSDTQYRARNYLEYIHYEQQEKTTIEEKTVIQKMSSDIRKTFIKEVNRKYIENIKCLIQNFNENTINKTLFIMQEINYSPEDIIFKQGEYKGLDENIYYIVNGVIELSVSKQKDNQNQNYEYKQATKKLTKGQVFGEIEFFSDTFHSNTAKSKQFCTLILINKKQFLEILQRDNPEYQKFCMIKENIIFSNSYGIINQKCDICQKSNHFENQCNLIQYQPNKKRIIKLSQLQNQKRDGFFHRKSMRLKINSIKQIAYQNYRYKKFHVDNKDLINLINELSLEDQNFNQKFQQQNNQKCLEKLKNENLIEKFQNENFMEKSKSNKNENIKMKIQQYLKDQCLNISKCYFQDYSINKTESLQKQIIIENTQIQISDFAGNFDNEVFESFKNYEQYFVNDNIDNIIQKLNKKFIDKNLHKKKQIIYLRSKSSWQKI